MSITISNLTIAKANENPFELTIREENYPLAPLVFAEDTVSNKDIVTIKKSAAFINKDTTLNSPVYTVRIVVYIPFEVKTQPTLLVDFKGEAQKVITEGGQKIMARSFTLAYDYSSPAIPKQYTLWSVNFNYTLNGMQPVDYIITYLQNMDPKTSRGTVTTVQEL